MEYTIKITELVNRPIIRNDHIEEFLNKMTDEEIREWEEEVDNILVEEGVDRKFPDWNSAFLGKTIDRMILYNLFVLSSKK